MFTDIDILNMSILLGFRFVLEVVFIHDILQYSLAFCLSHTRIDKLLHLVCFRLVKVCQYNFREHNQNTGLGLLYI